VVYGEGVFVVESKYFMTVDVLHVIERLEKVGFP
jgi:hypothetical protein